MINSAEASPSNAKPNKKSPRKKFCDGEVPSESKKQPLKYGYVSILGRKREMEDPVMVVPPRKLPGGYSFFAAYGGPVRAQAGEACTDKLHRCLEKHTADSDEKELGWGEVMMECFGSMFEEEEEEPPESHGAMKFTAVVVGLDKGEVVLVNYGGSRAVLWSGGVASPLWNDHKADESVEVEGGRGISSNDGAVSPSKSQGGGERRRDVEVKVKRQNEKSASEELFVIIATDGLWNAVGKEMACQVVRKCLGGKTRILPSEGSCVSQAAALLAELAIAKGSKDNISIIVVQLN